MMKNFASFALLSLTSVASFGIVALGCSGGSGSSDPFGAEPDYAAVQQRFSSPTGTISERNMSSLFARYSDQKGASEMGNIGVGTSTSSGTSTSDSPAPAPATGTKSQALHILSGKSGLTASCSALAAGNTAGSCACPDGGSLTYDFGAIRQLQQATGPIDASLKVRFEGCRQKDLGIDGREFVHVHADRGGSKADLNTLELLLIADLTVSKGSETHTIDLAARLKSGEFELALAVDDGWVTIRATSSGVAGSGTFVIRDRNGTWTCEVQGGAGTCHDAQGNSRKF